MTPLERTDTVPALSPQPGWQKAQISFLFRGKLICRQARFKIRNKKEPHFGQVPTTSFVLQHNRFLGRHIHLFFVMFSSSISDLFKVIIPVAKLKNCACREKSQPGFVVHKKSHKEALCWLMHNSMLMSTLKCTFASSCPCNRVHQREQSSMGINPRRINWIYNELPPHTGLPFIYAAVTRWFFQFPFTLRRHGDCHKSRGKWWLSARPSHQDSSLHRSHWVIVALTNCTYLQGLRWRHTGGIVGTQGRARNFSFFKYIWDIWCQCGIC